MTHDQATSARGLILFWTIMLSTTGIGGIFLTVLGPPKPMHEAVNRTSPPRVAEPSKQPVDRFPVVYPSVQMINLLASPTTPKQPTPVPADHVSMAESSKTTPAPAASDAASGRTLFGIASIAVDQAPKREAVVTAPMRAVPGSDLRVPQAENPPVDQRLDPVATAVPVPASTSPPPPAIVETAPSSKLDGSPTAVSAQANSPAAASPQNFKFRIRASAGSTLEARARELINRLQSNFNWTTEWQSEAEVPASAVIGYPAAVDHATAMEVGRLVGSLGYAWHVEKLPAKFTEATIDIWLPNGKPAPLHQPARKPGNVASQVPNNKLIWSPSELPASPPNSIASGFPSSVLDGRPSIPASGSNAAKVSASNPPPAATANPGDIY
jgi:hypothetical protein